MKTVPNPLSFLRIGLFTEHSWGRARFWSQSQVSDFTCYITINLSFGGSNLEFRIFFSFSEMLQGFRKFYEERTQSAMRIKSWTFSIIMWKTGKNVKQFFSLILFSWFSSSLCNMVDLRSSANLILHGWAHRISHSRNLEFDYNLQDTKWTNMLIDPCTKLSQTC